MRTIFLMQPRQSGKTTKAMYEYLKDPDNTIFVSHNYDMAKYVRSIVGGDMKNFASENTFLDKICGRNPKNIILDEYMFFKNKKLIWEHINTIRPENVYIYSTSDKIYSKKLFDFVKQSKRYSYYSALVRRYEEVYGEPITEEIQQQLDDLYYNFLTDYNTTLIDFDINKPKKDYSDLKNIISKENFDLEINNIYLK